MGPVHPHIRGAYISRRSQNSCDTGSSPHTWGIQVWPMPQNQLNRFIPTYVGHTGVAERVQPTQSVHPHIRGAYTERQARLHAANGSSPHTWGIRFFNYFCPFLPRFIPTYVGHTSQAPSGGRGCAVHPHIRGAYRRIPSAETNSYGSSPHTWGIQAWPSSRNLLYRFIPTYVGHTLDRRKKNGWFQPLFL